MQESTISLGYVTAENEAAGMSVTHPSGPTILTCHMFPPYDMHIFSQSPQDQLSASECSHECSSWLVLLGQKLGHFKVYSILRSKVAIFVFSWKVSYSSPPTSLCCLAPMVGFVSRSEVPTCVSNDSPIATGDVMADGITFLLKVNLS